MAKPDAVAIIGYGRFGRLWCDILKDDFKIIVYDASLEAQNQARADGFACDDLTAALKAPVIFYCVPISQFEETLKSHLPYFAEQINGKVLIDMLSVKCYPSGVFARHLPEGYKAILTHPMFGPDSFSPGVSKNKIVMDGDKSDTDYIYWRDYFASRDFAVLELSAEEHDRMAARSQGITHFVGRTLAEFGMEATSIDTAGATKLMDIKNQVSSDSWQLFVDLQTYNPFTREMRVKLAESQSRVFNRLLPNRIDTSKLVVGIQGGRGSFNEEAASYYLERMGENSFELVYLHTTEAVLKALHEGVVDRGQFAMHNSTGGIVTESVQAMANYNFDIVEEFAIKIAHALMIAHDANFKDVHTIMTHPQVLRQCKTNLEKKYSLLKQTSGQGDLVDHAKVAELMGQNKMDKSIATMGSKILAKINGLKIVEDNLQDLDQNYTSFLWVQRPA